MGKERRIRLKFHDILSTSRNYVSPENTESYFFNDYTTSSQIKAPLITKPITGLHFSFDHLLQNFPNRDKTVEFFELDKNKVKSITKNNDDNSECKLNETHVSNSSNSSPFIPKKLRQYSEFLKKFDVVNHARRLYGRSNKRKSKQFNSYDAIPIYVTIPTLKYEVPASKYFKTIFNSSTPRKRLHGEKLKSMILNGNEELNALKYVISAQKVDNI